jgi:deoxyribonuclease V
MKKRIDIRKLKEDQLKLAKKINLKNTFSEIKTIAGVDQAYVDNKIISAIVVCDYMNLEPFERKYSILSCKIPYIPGYLSYREAPAIIEAYNKIINKPDILIVEGNGILHQRRIGMASHVGVLLNIPTIGVTKRLLCGELKEDNVIVDKEVRGVSLITREHAKPLYISPGHNITLKTSVEIIKKCIRLPHKLPEPLHLAHRYANTVREEFRDRKSK